MNNDKRPNCVFVYGTLMRGMCNHYLVSHAESIIEGWTYGFLFSLPYGYPAMLLPEQLPNQKPTKVYGELCFFDSKQMQNTLPKLDWLEDCIPNSDEGLYIRTIAKVRTHKGIFDAWVYVASPSFAKEVLEIGTLCKNGRWRPDFGS